MAQHPNARLLTVLSILLLPTSAAVSAPSDRPITIEVGSRSDRHRSFWDNLLASSEDTDLSDSEVAAALHGRRWIETVDRDGEVLLQVTRRWFGESSRSKTKNGEISVTWKYLVRASIRTRDHRDVLEATTTSSETMSESEASRSRRESYNDRETFERLGREMADRAMDWILDHLDELRPDRADAGFRYDVKHKWLLKGDGLEVTSVLPGSPAADAGLRAGDRIRAIDGEKGTTEMHVIARTWWVDPGRHVRLEVERNKNRVLFDCAIRRQSDWGDAQAKEQAVEGPIAETTAVRATDLDHQPSSVRIRPGMRQDEVERLLGRPVRVVEFESRTVWTYDGLSVVFVNGAVKDVQ